MCLAMWLAGTKVEYESKSPNLFCHLPPPSPPCERGVLQEAASRKSPRVGRWGPRLAPEPGMRWDGSRGRCFPGQGGGGGPATHPTSLHGERRGFLGTGSQRKCDMWQETQRLGRFSFCPDWWWIFPNHLVRTPKTCVCVHLRSGRVAGSSPTGQADAGQTPADSGRWSGDQGFRPVGFDLNPTTLRPWARVPLHQASVSRSVTWV